MIDYSVGKNIAPGGKEVFASRLHAGGDWRRVLPTSCVRCFNPRPRMGGDPASAPGIQALQGFNPRLRVGGDVRSLISSFDLGSVSIHASAREATR